MIVMIALVMMMGPTLTTLTLAQVSLPLAWSTAGCQPGRSLGAGQVPAHPLLQVGRVVDGV